jgi:LPS export ABC transporter permease LptG/LPS export ABC transporter permease LptF
VKTLDRYLIREVLPPFLLALGLFTFLLAVNPMLEQAQTLLAKGVDLPTVGFLLVTLLPQALGLTIPMALLAGLLMGLGRLSGDRETVALLACGVSPMRLLRPVIIFALLTASADLYVMTRLIPNSNQRFREITYRLLAKQGESDIKAGVFYEGFPGKVLFVREVRAEGGWAGVMLADIQEPGRPSITLAPLGHLEMNPVKREVSIVLPGESERYVPGDDDGTYDRSRARDVRFSVSADAVFGSGDAMLGRGRAEMTIADLRAAEAEKRSKGVSPHPEIMQRHQMFSFPVACFVFALVGVALGIHTRKEGKLGGFTLGIGVIFVYYGIMQMAEALTKGGRLDPAWSRWVPNILVGVLGIVALWMRTRRAGRDVSVRLPGWVRLPRRATRAGGRVRTTTSGQVVLVIRMPDIPLPTVRILDAYVSRRYVSIATLSFCGLLGLYYIGTFIDKTERIFKGQADGWLLAQYLYYSTPQFIVHVVPMATLVAVLATIGSLTRTGELIVMRACGISLYRAAAPLLLFSLVWSGGLFMLDDRVLAHANRRASDLEDTIKGSLPRSQSSLSNANWLADRDGRIYYYRAYEIPTRTLYGLSVFEPTRNWSRLTAHTFVQRAKYDAGVWRAGTGWVQRFPTADRIERDAFAARSLGPLAEPDQFSGVHNQAADLLTFGELRRQIADLAKSGFSLVESRVQLQERIAFPLVTLVMTLLGIPFGLTTGRRGALYGVGLAMVLGAAYWLLNTFFMAVGRAELLSPLLAAWATNILFLALATYATLTART